MAMLIICEKCKGIIREISSWGTVPVNMCCFALHVFYDVDLHKANLGPARKLKVILSLGLLLFFACKFSDETLKAL